MLKDEKTIMKRGINLKVENVCCLIERIAPAKFAAEWDNVGLLCGRRNANVSKVLLCVDVTTEVIDEAINNGCELIVSHHPFLMTKINSIEDSDFKSRQILTLAENKIAVIAAHTNADAVDGGMNDYLAKLLGVVDVKTTDFSIYLRVGKLGESNHSAGTQANRGAISVKSLVELVKKRLSLETAIVCGDLNKMVSRIGFYTGGVDAKELIAAKELFDVVITGEFSYHKALDLKEEGITAVLCGHFGSELLFTWWFKEILNRENPNLKVFISETQKEPFIFI